MKEVSYIMGMILRELSYQIEPGATYKVPGDIYGYWGVFHTLVQRRLQRARMALLA